MDFTWVDTDDTNAIKNAIVDAKGDLIAASAADTPARLAVGADGTTLVADSSTATGLKWAAPASGGGMTLLSTTALTGSTVTSATIAGTYKHLQVILKGVYQTSANGGVYMRMNSDTGNKYSTIRTITNSANTTLFVNANIDDTKAAAIIYNTPSVSTQDLLGHSVINIYNYTDTDVIFYEWTGIGFNDAPSNPSFIQGQGNYDNTAAITTITMFPDFTFSGGSMLIYGVS